MGPLTMQSIESHIRRIVAQSIETGALLDVREAANLIARAHGCQDFVQSIATDLAEAAVAARVPVKLEASVGSAARDLAGSLDLRTTVLR